eukprot:114504-Chlamydomonas_euryale.AAC.1
MPQQQLAKLALPRPGARREVERRLSHGVLHVGAGSQSQQSLGRLQAAPQARDVERRLAHLVGGVGRAAASDGGLQLCGLRHARGCGGACMHGGDVRA